MGLGEEVFDREGDVRTGLRYTMANGDWLTATEASQSAFSFPDTVTRHSSGLV
jgi:hypothetical protein